MASKLDKAYTVAGEGYNRWLVPTSALMIHLCVGMGYGMSVFWLPMSKALGVAEGLGKSKACPADMSWFSVLFTTECDWKVVLCSVVFSILFLMLGTTTAIFGNWLEHAGPRRCGLYSCICFCSFFFLMAISMIIHQLWLAWAASVIGGIGLGLGYITPVSTLIRWFPDRVGMATGMAVAGFGGGAMCGSPFAQQLMAWFGTSTSTGLWQTFAVLGIIYTVFMLAGCFTIRVPPPGYKPEGWEPDPNKNVSSAFNVTTASAVRTPQFWCCWCMLFLNIAAGIGVLAMASPLLQEVFAGDLIHLPGVKFDDLTDAQKGQVAMIAAGFAGLLSLFNILGRFVWASLSDKIGRRWVYYIFAAGGAALYASLPSLAASLNLLLFLACTCVCVSFYGGGYAVIPAYLNDLYGQQFVGAIHGRVLTAWSAAGLLSPLFINVLREMQLNAGVAKAAAYSMTLYCMAGLLVLEIVFITLIRPVNPKWHMTPEEFAAEKAILEDKLKAAMSEGVVKGKEVVGMGQFILRWIFVGVPLAYGVAMTAIQTAKMFM